MNTNQRQRGSSDDTPPGSPNGKHPTGQKVKIPDMGTAMGALGDALRKNEIAKAKGKVMTKSEKDKKSQWLLNHDMDQNTVCPACGDIAVECDTCYVDGCPLFDGSA